MQRASSSGSVAIGRNRSGSGSGWSVSRVSGTWFRAAPGHHRQQVQRGRIVVGEPVERHRPGRGQRLRVGPARVVVQQVAGPSVSSRRYLSTVRPVSASSDPGLLDRQWQIPDRRRPPGPPHRR